MRRTAAFGTAGAQVVAFAKACWLNGVFGQLVTLAAARGLRAPLALLVGALLARAVGPEGVGEWAMIVAAATLLHSVLLNWAHAVTVRFGCEERGRTGRLDATYTMRAPLVVAGLAVAASLLSLEPWDWGERVFGLDPRGLVLVGGYLVAMWLMAELQALMQVDARFRQIAFLPALTELCAAALLGACFLLDVVNVDTVLGGVVAVALLIAVVAALHEWLRLDVYWLGIDRRRVAAGALYAWPLIPNFLIGYFSAWGGHLILKFHFEHAEVGLFQAAYQLMGLLLGLSAPLATVLLPRLILSRHRDPASDRRFLEATVPTLLAVWLPCAILAAAIAPAVLPQLLGSRFESAVPVLAVLCIAVPGSIVTHVYGLLFTLQGRLGRTTLYLAWMSGINIVLSLVLVPSLGALGAASGAAVAYLAVQGLYLRDQHTYLAVPMGAVAGAIALSSGAVAMQAMLPSDFAFRLGLAALAAAAVVLLVRRCALADAGVLARMFPGRVAWIAACLAWLLAAHRTASRGRE